MKNEKTILVFLILFGVVIKFINIGFTNCISTNGLYFVTLAENLLNGEYGSAFSAYIPLLYPLLISILHHLVNNLEVSGQIISAISGIGVVMILYRLGKEMFNSRTGILMAVFGTVSPIFNRYSSKVMDDMPYGFLYTWAVYAGWRFLNTQDYKSGIKFALLAALSYCIRPEGLGIIVIVSGWFIFSKRWEIVNILKRSSLIIAINIFFIIFIIPQIFLIYKINGEFSFSGKTSYILRDIDKFDDEKEVLKEDIKPGNTMFSFEDSERTAYKRQGGFFGIIVNHTGIVIKKLGHNLEDYLLRIPQAIGYLLTIPLGFGIGYRKVFKYKKKDEMFFLSVIVFNLAALSLFKEKYRHLISAAPLLYIWCAIGICEIIHLIKSATDSMGRYKPLFNMRESLLLPLILSVCVVAILPQTFSNISEYNCTWRISAEKAAGKWISDNIPEDVRIISWDAGKVAYYAGIEPCLILNKRNDYEYVIEMAKKLDADYIVLNTHESERTKRALMEFFKQIKKEDLTFCYKTEYYCSNDNIQVHKFVKKS